MSNNTQKSNTSPRAALVRIVAENSGPDRNSYVYRIFYTKRLRTARLVAADTQLTHDVACKLLLDLMLDVRTYADIDDVREIAFTFAMDESVKMDIVTRTALVGVATEGRIGRIPVA
jgi:hypothetical protein